MQQHLHLAQIKLDSIYFNLKLLVAGSTHYTEKKHTLDIIKQDVEYLDREQVFEDELKEVKQILKFGYGVKV